MFNLAPDSVYRNCLDSKRGDCPYAEYIKYPIMKCVFDSDKVVDESTGCVPDAGKAEYFRHLLFNNCCPSGVETFKPNFRNIEFATRKICLNLSGRRYRVYEEE